MPPWRSSTVSSGAHDRGSGDGGRRYSFGLAAAPAFDISGNTYTSPQFAYTVTWADNWVVVEETSDQFDRLHLTDGLTFAEVVGGRSFAGNALVAATVFAAGIQATVALPTSPRWRMETATRCEAATRHAHLRP